MTSPYPTRPWAATALKAHDFNHDWDSYVTTKVKSLRAIALSGLRTFSEGGYSIPFATGFIELMGMRAGARKTVLQIGFTASPEIAAPSFVLLEAAAIGTLTFPSSCFGSILQFANCPTAHFRIGGDGSGNAIATEPTLLQTSFSD